jgi:large subunit ribosomal protein L21
MLAVIKTGGKQYCVTPGQRIKVETLPTAEGKDVVFKDVLLVEKNRSVTVGIPTVKGATVTGTVLQQARHDKVIVFKYKPKKRYKKKTGHRQPFTEVEITKIEAK